MYVISAIAAAEVLESIFGAILPLAVSSLCKQLGFDERFLRWILLSFNSPRYFALFHVRRDNENHIYRETGYRISNLRGNIQGQLVCMVKLI